MIAIPIYRKAKPWVSPRSRCVVLYHGCTALDSASIQKSGIDPTRGRVDADFGRGFYTTSVRYQAEQWAWIRFYNPAVAYKTPNRPVVLKFVVDRYDLAYLSSIQFVLGGPRKENFWSLVQHCRQSTLAPTTINDHRGPVLMADGTRWYDLASGPVAAFWRQRFAMQDADQFSFHTPAAAYVLQKVIMRGGQRFKELTVN